MAYFVLGYTSTFLTDKFFLRHYYDVQNVKQVMISTYPGFDYKADELRKFLASTDIFTILLNNGQIIHFTAKDKAGFYGWLIDHKIEDIKFDKCDKIIK